MSELIHRYVDLELDPARSREAEQHLKDCPACSQNIQEQQALRRVIAGRARYHKAPPELIPRVRTMLREASQDEASRASRPTWTPARFWLRLLAPMAIAGLALLLAFTWMAIPSKETRVTQDIVSAHVRSLLPNHLMDVASTDQHTVKPWFNGKVTFSPPVVDLTAQEFPLIGGRLDIVADQPVAVLVYQRHKHVINLFVWPSGGNASSREKSHAERGYNIAQWTGNGMNCWAISDLNRDELMQFAQLVRTQPPRSDK